MTKKKQESEHVYQLEITEKQAKMLSYTCDQFARLICGQDWSYRDLFEAAWEKRCKEATGNMIDKEFEGGWYEMRAKAEEICKHIKKVFWSCEANAMYGVNYDDTADILFDINQVLRHQLWLDRPDEQKSRFTVDSDEARQYGSEPLAKIKKIK